MGVVEGVVSTGFSGRVRISPEPPYKLCRGCTVLVTAPNAQAAKQAANWSLSDYTDNAVFSPRLQKLTTTNSLPAFDKSTAAQIATLNKTLTERPSPRRKTISGAISPDLPSPPHSSERIDAPLIDSNESAERSAAAAWDEIARVKQMLRTPHHNASAEDAVAVAREVIQALTPIAESTSTNEVHPSSRAILNKYAVASAPK